MAEPDNSEELVVVLRHHLDAHLVFVGRKVAFKAHAETDSQIADFPIQTGAAAKREAPVLALAGGPFGVQVKTDKRGRLSPMPGVEKLGVDAIGGLAQEAALQLLPKARAKLHR